ncbi:hypothetical protein [Thermocrinis minervae]|uniref:Uncharacterized protein n=1 Tax=Thermocrinis minervae TaxID=381751 RepID=A0A1M6QZZ8_9AQUI|nr:hypothetical protein [Thermocrinis minervae]SHK25658.1 hypothetical protein SAMN05444391_0459 [Thermocrinis minervae]
MKSNTVLSLILVILGMALSVLGSISAFTLYANNKLKKVNTNFAKYMLDVYSGASSVKLPYEDINIFVLRDNTGKVIATLNTINTLDIQAFTYTQQKSTAAVFSVYTKSFSIGEFTNVLMDNPAWTGIFFSGFILLALGLFNLVSRSDQIKVETERKLLSDEYIINKLKALRLTIGTAKLLPEESLQEAKKILDDILKSVGGRQ